MSGRKYYSWREQYWENQHLRKWKCFCHIWARLCANGWKWKHSSEKISFGSEKLLFAPEPVQNVLKLTFWSAFNRNRLSRELCGSFQL